MPYSPEQFSTAYTALVQLFHGLRYIDVQEIIRHVREATAQQTDPEQLAATLRLMDILESADALRETMKAKGIPRMPNPIRPRQPSSVVRGQTGHG
jgi:hypothetical protein